MRRLLSGLVEVILRLILRIIVDADIREFKKIPSHGPLIIVFNHVNFLEVPLLYLSLKPRSIHYMAKKETWENPFRGWMADNWESIPVNRGDYPNPAFRSAAGILANRGILLLAPEGTRSEDGVLRHGRGGAVVLALENRVPILPVGHFGAESIRKNLKRLRRTKVTYAVGRPFRLLATDHPEKEERNLLTDAVMSEIASLLPVELRGEYRETSLGTGSLSFTD